MCKAKGWKFNVRGKDGVNVHEIVETLTRENPVAVVTLVPTIEKPTRSLVVVHSSLMHKCRKCSEGNRELAAFVWQTRDGRRRFTAQIEESEQFTSFSCDDFDTVGVILDALRAIHQMALPDKTEYVAMVNYPKL